MITVKNKIDCCGCWACFSSCPKKCIDMKEDEEGFRYPVVDTEKCIDCHLCEKVCPILHPVDEIVSEQKGYIVQHRNNEILRESTSGGAFTAIASWVLSKGGVVFGAAYDDNLIVHHTYVNNFADLKKFRNSKYTQSEIRTAYIDTKRFLKNGIIVLFSGTPCQIEGLCSFLRKKYENLILLDVVCRAVPSPLVFRKYKEMKEERQKSRIQELLFRDKRYGYKYSTMTLKYENGNVESEGIDTDGYLRAFFSGISLRQSCMDCKFRKRYRVSDFTIWDCFDVDRYSSDMNNDKGATKVIAHTEKAREIMKGIYHDVKYISSDVENMLTLGGGNDVIIKISAHPLRKNFFDDISTLPPAEVFEKYFPVRLKNKLEKKIRIITAKTGLYNIIKKCYVAIVGRENIKR